MGMTPDNYFETFVFGNYEDCQQEKGNIRYAFNAAVSASHMADHYYTFYKKHDQLKIKQFKNLGDFVEYLSNQTNGCFQDIRSISNAYKHLYTSVDPKKAIYSTISSPGVVESISFNDKRSELQSIEEDWELSSQANDFESRVVFTRKDVNRIDFLTTLDTVIKLWESLL